MVAIPRVDRRPRMSPCEFRRYRLAEDCRPEIAQPLDHPGIRGGNLTCVDRRPVRRRHVGGSDDVLDRHRNAGERARPPRGIYRQIFERFQFGLEGLRLPQAAGRVFLRRRLVISKQTQKFQYPRIRPGYGACSRIGHPVRPRTDESKTIEYQTRSRAPEARAYFIATAGSMYFFTTKAL